MKPRLAVLGTGLMGGPMARNLLKSGFPLAAWNRTRSKAEALAPAGAEIAPSAAAAVAAAEIAIVMLESGAVVDEVLFESGKVAETLKAGALLIDMSSIEPRQARSHAERLRERGIGYLDAPVSGGTAGAEAGTLAIMAGGSAADFGRARPVFEAMGRPTLVGPAGSGQLAKLCNQAIVAIAVGAVSEALLLAAAGGADPAVVRQALMGGSADSPILRNQGQRLLERNFVPGGAARMVQKDCRNILAEAQRLGLRLPLCECIAALYGALAERGGADYDHTAVLLELERVNGGKRVTDAPDRLPG